jgi:hypothetical protein
MILSILALLASITPANKTTWMRPDLFHLVIGMPRAEAEKTLEMNGWKTKPGDDPNHVVVDYSDDKGVTLQFRKDRLSAVNFELFAFVPQAKQAFEEQRDILHEKFGNARRSTPSIILYDDRLPNVMVVLSADPKSEHGRRGLGMLAVRYYDPR